MVVKDPYKDETLMKQVDAMYKAAKTDDERDEVMKILEKQLGKSIPSIRMVLSNRGVYVAKTRKAKDGSEIVRKSELVDKINAVLNLDLTEAEATSLEKATKTTLRKLLGLQPRLVGFADDE